MRRIAVINQKGGVGKTTTTVNLGAALAREGRRVVLADLDPQANLSLHLDLMPASRAATTYSVLLGNASIADALRDTSTQHLRLLPANIDLSGAEMELASAIGREQLLREALDLWEAEHRAAHGRAPADYVLLDCPPSLGLLSVNGLVAAREAIIALQTEFFALQGIAKLLDVVAVLKRRLNPGLEVTGILPCLYDSRLKLAREVLAEIRGHFGERVFRRAIAKNVKLAEAPSYGKTIFEYAPESPGAQDYALVALEVIAQEARDPELAALAGAPKSSPGSSLEPSVQPARGDPDANEGELRTVTLRPAQGAPPPAEPEPRPPPRPSTATALLEPPRPAAFAGGPTATPSGATGATAIIGERTRNGPPFHGARNGTEPPRLDSGGIETRFEEALELPELPEDSVLIGHGA
ncbi:MAG TPA: AAA family ATPase [Planctomycetota bacterium]|nr:AAA family ATPase [Planctomycetota bacterium]